MIIQSRDKITHPALPADSSSSSSALPPVHPIVSAFIAFAHGLGLEYKVSGPLVLTLAQSCKAKGVRTEAKRQLLLDEGQRLWGTLFTVAAFTGRSDLGASNWSASC